MTAADGLFVTTNADELRRATAAARRQGKTVGCVPTMGALHAGHTSLIEAARRETDFVVVTVFVNPSQFAPGEDLEAYPRPIEDDLKACRDAEVNVVFLPPTESLYPEGYSTWVDVEGLSRVLEGASRPTHFRGVATIVLKLLNIVGPDAAFFGTKDYQQLALLRRMVRDLHVPVRLVPCPTVREPDGLALSSRNVYLSSKERKSALALHESLRLAEERLLSGETDLPAIATSMEQHLNSRPGVETDYAVIADADTLEVLSAPREQMVVLVAARVGKTRLIDNLPVTIPSQSE
ncbi:MAG: pantoate--beta-alanine ligase [Planctomycetota bacterium]|nr:MAG: pantoate--beta-alanine ligase [Planctomycetota bacterium]REJ97006.1 MAG: pantoate--beta-alanine ligase [Planctomycetota bacterium]REK20129.1 MAG: pantoate--beta-alanine ligase [Planctomycetota bacterium]REK34319.1 MAG: pantoate--beta-alanine ligase [Planctomycetota bacterium]